MNDQELEQKAIREVESQVARGPREPRVVHCEAEVEWYPDLLCNLSEHRLNVLERAGDIIVYYDDDGKEVGWRDDGRKGTEHAKWIDRESFHMLVVKELDLPRETRLGILQARELPPLGWTHEGVFFLSPTATPDEVLRVWVDPENLHIIQCLLGPAEVRKEGGRP